MEKQKKKTVSVVKRMAAGVLSVAMVLTATPLGGLTAQGANILQPNYTLQPATANDRIGLTTDGTETWSYGSSENSAYAFGKRPNLSSTNGGPSPQDTYSFNIGVVKNQDVRLNNTKGYNVAPHTGAPGPGWKTIAWESGPNWWSGHYAFGKPFKIGTNVQDLNPATNVYGTRPVDPKPTYNADHSVASAVFNTSGGLTSQNAPNKMLHTPAGDPYHTDGKYKNGDVMLITDPENSANQVELRQEIKPSADDQWLLVEYTVHNLSTNTIDFNVGHQADITYAGTWSVPTWITKHGAYTPGEWEGLHVSTIDVGHINEMDIVTWKPSAGIGMQRRDASDLSETRVWTGTHGSTGGVSLDNWVFGQNPESYIRPNDTDTAFSAYFNLLPGETKTAVIGISTKLNVYYTDPGYTGGGSTGFMGTPMTSIEDAIQAGGAASQSETIYVYVQNNMEINNTIHIPAGKHVIIQTADFDSLPAGGNYAIGYKAVNAPIHTGAPYTIKRAAGFTGPMFTISDSNTSLGFQDIIVDGGGADTTPIVATSPLIEASDGTINMRKGSTIQNVRVAGADVAQVAKLTGNAVFNIDSTKGVSETRDNAVITNNTSDDNGNAIDATGSGTNYPIRISGKFDVSTNKAYNGTRGDATPVSQNANLALGEKQIRVDAGNKVDASSKISLSIAGTRLPETEEQGTPIADFEDRAAQEAEIAGGIRSMLTLPYSATNFGNDKAGQTNKNANTLDYITPAAGGGNQVNGFIYLYAKPYEMNIRYVDDNNQNIPFSTTDWTWPPATPITDHVSANPVESSRSVGATINVVAPTIAGYVFDSVSPTTLPTGLTNTSGTITGTMPEADVDLTIKYKRTLATYKFDTQGGRNIGDMYENVSTSATASILTLPTPTKTGFNFTGWKTYIDVDNDGEYTAGTDTDGVAFTAFPAPTTVNTTYLYATWTPGAGTYPFLVRHKNSSLSKSITFGTESVSYPMLTTLARDPYSIPGYIYYRSTNVPSNEGSLNQTNGHFALTMPPRAVTLNYTYQPDVTVKKHYTVKHQDMNGTDLVPPRTTERIAEQSINAQPDSSLAGYTYNTFDIVAGETSNMSAHITGLDIPTLVVTKNLATGLFQGYMPNQDVEIVYKYNFDNGSNVIRRFFDRESNVVLGTAINGLNPGDNINLAIPAPGTPQGNRLYGYIWDGSSTAVVNPAASATVNSSGIMTGTMPLPSGNVKGDYKLSRNPALWRDISFAVASQPNNQGSVNALPSGTSTKILVSDGSAAGNENAYSFAKLEALDMVPDVTANRYYMFDGWYMDAAATVPVTRTSTWTTGTAPIVLYAKFVENPSQWFDINFVSGTNGTISAPASIHIPYDYTWGQIAPQIPTATPVINYNFNGWNDVAGNHMTANTALTNNATYTAIFGKDPNAWGTNMGSISPIGRIASDGSGEIVIDGSVPGNIYVISDPSGNILAVVPGEANISRTKVPGLTPGAHYNVQEGTPDTKANIGNNISTITGTSVSAPQDVYIPTVDNNYNVGYDPENDGMAQIVINPADPDADYALIDENGNVLDYPGSDKGWMTPVGNNPSTVTFNNLNPNATYTVVARKKGNTAISDPLTKLADGNQIIANPGDLAQAAKYIVETRQGSIVSVENVNVGSDIFTEAKATDTVVIHADSTDANGKKFLYWRVLAGRAVGVSGNIVDADYTFKLSSSNIVLKAVYEPTKIAGDDANVEEDLRGKAGVGEFGLEPSQIPALANLLTTPADRALNSVNNATIDYKVIFNKRDTTGMESSLVKPSSYSGINHPEAYTTAYSLDIKLERYVDGRRVDAGIIATASNASIDVIAQLPASDVDQLDYQLFDVTTGTPVETVITSDVANNAGLVKFTGNLLHTYVMVYSKTFKITFVDNKPVLDHLHLNDTGRNFYKQFKVRKKDSVEDSDYALDYAAVTAYAQNDVPNALKTPFEDIYGVQYDYVNWSKKEDKLSVLDTKAAVTKRIVAYAYYSDNRKEVAKARIDLAGTIEEARNLTGDPYLKLGEVNEINTAIAHALETLRQARDLISPEGSVYLRQANYEELLQAINALRELINKYSGDARDRADARIRKTGGAGGGGNSSSGRGSKLLAPGEKSKQTTAINENSNTRVFVLGVDGAWEKNPVTGGWSFVLNGGTPINDMWGMITWTDGNGNKTSRWYYFDSRSTMATGWTYDSKNGSWYYLNPAEGADLGQMMTGWVKDGNDWYFMDGATGVMVTGWHRDSFDTKWYYLLPNGKMATGWNNIGGSWYYFNAQNSEPAWSYNEATMKWELSNPSGRSYGSMYVNEPTPDGYNVNAEGAWMN